MSMRGTMTTSFNRPRAIYSAVILGALLLPSTAWAEGDKVMQADCVSAFETAQELRSSGDLVTARARLLSCIRTECPSSVRVECGKWFEQVEREVPTFVVSAQADGEDRTDVQVEMDGKPVQDSLDGKAVQVNPGAHSFRFYLAPFDALEKKIVISEGDKLRVIAVEFQTPKPAAPPPTPPPAPALLPAPRATHRPVPPAVYVLGGVAALGGASFAYFAVTGANKQNDLKASCAPSCSKDDVQNVRSKYLLADISLGVGVAALATSTVLYLTRPDQPLDESAQISVSPTHGGMNASARFRF